MVPVTEETFDALQGDGIELLPYGEVGLELASFEGRLWLDSASANCELREAAGGPVIEAPSPVARRKEQKNPQEI